MQLPSNFLRGMNEKEVMPLRSGRVPSLTIRPDSTSSNGCTHFSRADLNAAVTGPGTTAYARH